jgi:hypothetical protein
VLGEKGGATDPLPAIKAALIATKAGELSQSLPALADAILSAKPLALHQAILDHTSLNRDSSVQNPPFDWDYGSARERQNLRTRLWKTARIEAPVEPAEARRLARAAILFDAMDDFPFGTSNLYAFVRDARGLDAAGISPEMATALQRALDQFFDRHQENVDAAGKQIDRLFKHPLPAEFDLAIARMDEWFKQPLTDDDQHYFARFAQQLLTHAALTKDPALLENVTDHLKHWLATSPPASDNHFKRWLVEAAKPTEKPERLINIVYIDANGRETQTDTDGVKIEQPLP